MVMCEPYFLVLNDEKNERLSGFLSTFSMANDQINAPNNNKISNLISFIVTLVESERYVLCNMRGPQMLLTNNFTGLRALESSVKFSSSGQLTKDREEECRFDLVSLDATLTISLHIL